MKLFPKVRSLYSLGIRILKLLYESRHGYRYRIVIAYWFNNPLQITLLKRVRSVYVIRTSETVSVHVLPGKDTTINQSRSKPAHPNFFQNLNQLPQAKNLFAFTYSP